MSATVSRLPDPSTQIVAIALNGGRVTADFRSSVFAAAAREGISVNEFVLRATAKVLRDRGARFEGVFEAGDIRPADGVDPYADGGHHPTQMQLGSVYVPDREHRAIMAARGNRNLAQWAVDCIKGDIERRAARGI